MSRARKTIIYNGCICHVFWQMAHKDFLLQEEEDKMLLERCILRYKKKYNVYILERNIMDNHVHLIVYVHLANDLSNFMRDVNSLFARLYNKRHNRCGNVIMDRFKSPVIQSTKYLIKLIGYIWLNHVKSNKYSIKQVKNNPYCSLYYRSRGLIDPLCDSYQDFCDAAGIVNVAGTCEKSFCNMLLNYIIKRFFDELVYKVYEHLHSIGNKEFIKLRKYKKHLETLYKGYVFNIKFDDSQQLSSILV